MVENLIKHKHYLDVLCAHGKDGNFNKSLFKCAPNSLISVLSSLAHNTVTGIVPLSAEDIQTLKKYSTYLHTLACKDQDLDFKRSFLIGQSKTGDLILPFLIAKVLKELENSDYYD